MATVFQNPAHLLAKLEDAANATNTAKHQDAWAYVGTDGRVYTHPTKAGAEKLAQGLFTLKAEYDTAESVVMSADETVLRMFGTDHHTAAKIKPELTLIDPTGKTIATMDIWASVWVEA